MNGNERSSDLTEYQIACLNQHYYVADGDRLKHYLQPETEPDVRYTDCTLDQYGKEGLTIADLQGTFSFAADLGSLSITPDDACILPVALQRENKTTAGTVLSKLAAGGGGAGGAPDILWDALACRTDRAACAQRNQERWRAASTRPQLTPDEAMALLRNGTLPM